MRENITYNVDYKANAINKTISQYQESPNFIGLLSSLCDIFTEFKDVLRQVNDTLNLDKAVGDQLDKIGQNVGATRYLDNVKLNDDTFRAFIKAMIIRNNCDSTIDDIGEALAWIFSTRNIQLQEQYPMTVLITVNGGFGGIDVPKLIKFNILPKPSGVQFNYYDPSSGLKFGFDDTSPATSGNPIGYYDDDTLHGSGKWIN